MISIIICTLNEEYYLPRLLDSIVEQKLIDYEVIVVDGGSTDETQMIGAKYEKTYSNIRFFKCLKGIAKQRNYGAKLATNNRLLFLDADVEIGPSFLPDLLREVIDHKILVAGTRIYAIEKKWNYRLSFALYSHVYLPVVRLIHPIIHGCSIYSTKEIHNAIGGFQEEILFEDYLYGKMASKIYRSKILKTVFVKTSARRFYSGNSKQIIELIRGGFLTLFKVGLSPKYFKDYNVNTGKHKNA